jgi:hypothetical protein
MAFINEYISQEDVEKYHLEEIDKHFFCGTRARDWTIDRTRDIYLRNVEMVSGPDPDPRGQTKWTFFWHDSAITLQLDSVTGGGGRGEPGWSHWRLASVNSGNGLPLKLRRLKDLFLQDLKSALLAYKDGGVFASCTSYEVVFDVAEECML